MIIVAYDLDLCILSVRVIARRRFNPSPVFLLFCAFFSRFHGLNSTDNHSLLWPRMAAARVRTSRGHIMFVLVIEVWKSSSSDYENGSLPTSTVFDAGWVTGIHFPDKNAVRSDQYFRVELRETPLQAWRKLTPVQKSPWRVALRGGSREIGKFKRARNL